MKFYLLPISLMLGIIAHNTFSTETSLLPAKILLAQASEETTTSPIYAPNTASPPHFYVKLQRMTMNKKECKRLAKEAMTRSGFADLAHGKHGVWGVKQGYKAQIKCSKSEAAIVFIVVGQTGEQVMIFNDQLQKNFGSGFSIIRDTSD